MPLRFARASLDTGVRVHYAEQGDAGGRPIALRVVKRRRMFTR